MTMITRSLVQSTPCNKALTCATRVLGPWFLPGWQNQKEMRRVLSLGGPTGRSGRKLVDTTASKTNMLHAVVTFVMMVLIQSTASTLDRAQAEGFAIPRECQQVGFVPHEDSSRIHVNTLEDGRHSALPQKECNQQTSRLENSEASRIGHHPERHPDWPSVRTCATTRTPFKWRRLGADPPFVAIEQARRIPQLTQVSGLKQTILGKRTRDIEQGRHFSVNVDGSQIIGLRSSWT